MIASVEAVGGDHNRWLGGPIARAVQPWNKGGGNCVDACTVAGEVMVSPTFDVVANAIATTCRVPRDAIVPESNMVSDLGIDSLELLDLGFALEDMLGVRVPLDTWLHAVHMRTEAAE